MGEDKSYDSRVEEAMSYVQDLVKRENEAEDQGSMHLDTGKLMQVVAEAGSAKNLRFLKEEAERQRHRVDKELADAEDKISNLEETLQGFRNREIMHTGMCAAFEKALISTAQGFATGK